MPINYSLLKEAEKEIMDEFLEYYNQAIQLNSSLLTFLDENQSSEKSLDDDLYEKLYENSKRIEVLYQDMLSNCIWLIQKEEPRAAHLRFIIAIIYSIKNISNSSTYMIKIARSLNKHKFDGNLLSEIIRSYKISMDWSYKIKMLIEQRSTYNDEFYNDLSNYHTDTKKTIKSIVKSYELNDEIARFIIIIGQIERIVDFQENIVSDFSLIKK